MFGLVLVGVGLSLAFGIYPLLGAGAIALFFLGVTPVVHGSWSVEDPERRQAETTDFSKNATFFGAALVFVVLSGTAWPCALTIDL